MEIKSRMWDTLKKEMRHEPFLKTGDESGDWIVFLSNQLQPEEKFKGCLVFNSPYPRERFIEMRYTDMKDKNTKEIYERDIMRIKLQQIYSMSESRMLESKIVIGEVRIRPVGGTGIIVRKIDIEGAVGIGVGSFLRIKKGKDEVIGNTFENPEIIREVKE